MQHHDLDPIDRHDVESRVSCPRCSSRASVALVNLELRDASATYGGECRRCGTCWRGVWYAVSDVVRVLDVAA